MSRLVTPPSYREAMQSVLSRTRSPQSASSSSSSSSDSALCPVFTERLPSDPDFTSTAPPGFEPESAVAVVAFDFGTSCTGYGHQFRVNAHEPVVIADQPPFCGLKTQTDVLISLHHDDVLLFGSHAQRRYLDMDDAARRNCVFFRRFKMCLFGDELPARPMVQSSTGVEWPAVRVFAACLRYLKCEAIATLKKAWPHSLTANDVHWLLTVPAIWSEQAKQLMRDAAALAGLISDPQSRQLLLVLEPETASIRCREATRRLVGADARFAVGTVYILLDVGGGTLDCVVHRITGDGQQIEEVEKSNGRDLGSTNIDRAFVSTLYRAFGEQVVREFALHPLYAADYVEWLQAFELLKLDVRGARSPGASNNVSKTYNCVVPESFKEWLEERGKSFAVCVAECRDPPLKPSRRGFTLTHAGMLSLFEPTVAGIVRHALDRQSRAKDASFVFLVGGLGECDVLLERLEDAFKLNANRAPSPPRVLRPEKSSLAVLAGAIRWGISPPSIVRRMRFGYGVDMMKPWDAELHANRKKVMCTRKGRQLARTPCYYPFVTINQPVPEDSVKDVTCAAWDDQTRVVITLYRTTLAAPEWTDQADVVELGQVEVPIGQYLDDDDRDIQLQMLFGGTELKVKVTHPKSGREDVLRIDMDTHRQL